MNTIYIALPFIQFLISSVLATIVILSDHKDRTNRLFVAFLVAMGLWGLTLFGMRDAFPDPSRSYLWERFALAVIPFTGVFFAHFVIAYTRASYGRSIVHGMYFVAIVSAALAISGFAATGMEEKFYGFAPALGWAFPIVLMAAYPPVLLALIVLTRAARNGAISGERSRLNLLRLGLLASIVGGTSDILPSLGVNIYPMGVIGSVLFVILTTWAVSGKQMLRLRLVQRRGFAYILISSLIFALQGLALAAALALTHSLSGFATVIAVGGFMMLAGIVIQPVLAKGQNLVDRLFFRERRDRLETLGHLSDAARDHQSVAAFAARCAAVMRSGLQSEWVSLFLTKGEDDSDWRTIASTEESMNSLNLPANGAIASWLEQHLTPLFLDDIDGELSAKTLCSAENDYLASTNATVLIPIHIKQQIKGVIAIGPRLVEQGYGRSEMDFAVSCADSAAIALALFENVELRDLAEKESLRRIALAELGRQVASSLDTQQVFSDCADKAGVLVPYGLFEIKTIEEQNGQLKTAFKRDLLCEQTKETPRQEQLQRAITEAVQTRRLVAAQICLETPFRSAEPRRAANRSTGAMIIAPLAANGSVLGVMILISGTQTSYTSEEIGMAEAIAVFVSNATSNALMYEQALALADARERHAKLDAENSKLQRINEMKAQLLSMVSHELRTPLTCVMAFADLLASNKNENLEDRQLHHVSLIQSNGRRLKALIDDLLDVSSFDQHRPKITPVAVDPHSIIDSVVEETSPIFLTKKQRIMYTKSPHRVSANLDLERFAQVLTNLLSNASKYSPSGSDIRITTRCEEGRFSVEVADKGIGISREDRASIFTPFFRADNGVTRAQQGTGLGLVIAKKIVELHQGTITFQSEVGTGTTFLIQIPELPRRRDAEDALTAAQIPGHIPSRAIA